MPAIDNVEGTGDLLDIEDGNFLYDPSASTCYTGDETETKIDRTKKLNFDDVLNDDPEYFEVDQDLMKSEMKSDIKIQVKEEYIEADTSVITGMTTACVYIKPEIPELAGIEPVAAESVVSVTETQTTSGDPVMTDSVLTFPRATSTPSYPDLLISDDIPVLNDSVSSAVTTDEVLVPDNAESSALTSDETSVQSPEGYNLRSVFSSDSDSDMDDTNVRGDTVDQVGGDTLPDDEDQDISQMNIHE